MATMKGARLTWIVLVLLAAVIPTQMGGCLDGIISTVKDITPAEAQTLIADRQDDPDFIILDVRTAEEFATGYIEGAENFCLLCSASFRDDLASFDPDKTYLVYCQGGGRSATATSIMVEEGFSDVYNLVGGISAWVDAGYPVVVPE